MRGGTKESRLMAQGNVAPRGGTGVRPAAAAGDGGENPHSLLPRQERTRLFIGVREKPLHGVSPV